jgi:sulfur-oxidizing protein SoxB
MKEQNGVKIAIIGQAFPYTPIANPRHMVEEWNFGIKDHKMQEMVEEARQKGAQVVVVLSHNGMDVDLKMATRVTGIDAIMGGHTHDAVPAVTEVKNAGGKTLVINSGSMAKFLSVLDLDVKGGKIRGYKFRLVPVFSRLIEPDAEMSAYITKVRKPFEKKLSEELAVSNDLLYRRDTFNGTFDQLIMDAMIEVRDAQIAFSPGFRWGMNVLPGQPITFEDVMTQTAITYPEVTRTEMTGNTIKNILEEIADNRFSDDPYSQQGGDMARVGEMKYTIDPSEKIGNRIQYMELNGDLIEPNKKYVVAGWASVSRNPEGPPIWDVVAQYLRDKKTVSIKEVNVPKLKNVKNDPGISG